MMTTVTDPDVWRVAALIITQHGESALAHASERADKERAAGDEAGWAMWRQICLTIEELLRTEPVEGESRH